MTVDEARTDTAGASAPAPPRSAGAPRILRPTASELPWYLDGLAALLADTVAGGASLGFLSDLDEVGARAWWERRIPEAAAGGLWLWIARDTDGGVIGTISLYPVDKPNGRHRGEIAKLMVSRAARRGGVARALLTTAERAAADAGLTLLVLDTETGSPAENFYRAAGWTEVGRIPDYAADPAGRLRPTTIFHRDPRDTPPAGAGRG
ncbi:GNAT family N-acetyltransferase [Streptomyces alkaliphilus]|uniref:GNAT family N-acetyltransferase n=1 Tax=Streptomyces alkaliphilus TaxID=1472722 RepID=A0A7W3TFM5_9ACTN|nr:GNAT family N-acetyltransferase [Streptomyces alkaliphilus]MBB0245882.1 GNAT family N-acetyltransferase [Streptomyces alkaliphilus]